LKLQDPERFVQAAVKDLTPEQINAVVALEGETYRHRWQLGEALRAESDSWQITDPGQTSQHENELNLVCEIIHRQMNLKSP